MKRILLLLSIFFAMTGAAQSQAAAVQPPPPGDTTRQLSPDSVHARRLGEVVVVGRTPLVRLSAGKVVLDVAGSPLAAGGNAYEALLHTPGITDQGGLHFRGEKILLLLDGMDTHLAGDDLTALLNGLPATGIDRVEVLTTPSSRYEAKGVVVVNIISTLSKTFGWKETATAGLFKGKFLGGSAGLSGHYRGHKVNFTGGYDYTGNTLESLSGSNRSLDQDHLLLESHLGQSTRRDQSVRASAEYTPHRNTTFGLQVKGLVNAREVTATTRDLFRDSGGAIDSGSLTAQTSSARYFIPAVDLYFLRMLDSAGTQLSFRADYLGYRKSWRDHFQTEDADAVGKPAGNALILRDQSPANNRIWALSADYTRTTGFAHWEAGVKTTFSYTDNDIRWQQENTGVWTIDGGKTNHFLYSENVAAAYVDGSKKIQNFSLGAGLRYEGTYTTGRSLTLDTTNNRRYGNFFPRASVTWKASADQEWELAYRKSIQRFDYDVVNPFIRYQGRYAYYQGNPGILPEINHTFSLTHSYKDLLVSSVSCLYARNVLTEVYKKDTGNTQISTYTNLAHGLQLSANISWSQSLLAGVWTTSTSLMGIYAKYLGGGGTAFSNGGFSLLLQSDQDIVLGKGWRAQASGTYTAPMALGVYHFRANACVDLALSRSWWNSRGRLTLSLKDVLNSNRNRYSIDGFGIVSNNVKKQEDRVLRLTFSWAFGHRGVAAAKVRNTGLEDEQGRLN